MDNYIVGVNHAVIFARELRSKGIRIKRIKKGIWQVIDAQSNVLTPAVGDNVYISIWHEDSTIFLIPERKNQSYEIPEMKRPLPIRYNLSFRYYYGIW